MKMNKNNIKIIVLTGGPCSGKSEGVKELKRILSDSDYKAITIPELATEMRQMGSYVQKALYQKLIFKELFLKCKFLKKIYIKMLWKKVDKK